MTEYRIRDNVLLSSRWSEFPLVRVPRPVGRHAKYCKAFAKWGLTCDLFIFCYQHTTSARDGCLLHISPHLVLLIIYNGFALLASFHFFYPAKAEAHTWGIMMPYVFAVQLREWAICSWNQFRLKQCFHTQVMSKVLSVMLRANGLNYIVCHFGQFFTWISGWQWPRSSTNSQKALKVVASGEEQLLWQQQQ